MFAQCAHYVFISWSHEPSLLYQIPDICSTLTLHKPRPEETARLWQRRVSAWGPSSNMVTSMSPSTVPSAACHQCQKTLNSCEHRSFFITYKDIDHYRPWHNIIKSSAVLKLNRKYSSELQTLQLQRETNFLATSENIWPDLICWYKDRWSGCLVRKAICCRNIIINNIILFHTRSVKVNKTLWQWLIQRNKTFNHMKQQRDRQFKRCFF